MVKISQKSGWLLGLALLPVLVLIQASTSATVREMGTMSVSVTAMAGRWHTAAKEVISQKIPFTPDEVKTFRDQVQEIFRQSLGVPEVLPMPTKIAPTWIKNGQFLHELVEWDTLGASHIVATSLPPEVSGRVIELPVQTMLASQISQILTAEQVGEKLAMISLWFLLEAPPTHEPIFFIWLNDVLVWQVSGSDPQIISGKWWQVLIPLPTSLLELPKITLTLKAHSFGESITGLVRVADVRGWSSLSAAGYEVSNPVTLSLTINQDRNDFWSLAWLAPAKHIVGPKINVRHYQLEKADNSGVFATVSPDTIFSFEPWINSGLSAPRAQNGEENYSMQLPASAPQPQVRLHLH